MLYHVFAPNILCTLVTLNTLGIISSITTLYSVPVLALLYNILQVTLSPIVAVVLFTIFVICNSMPVDHVLIFPVLPVMHTVPDRAYPLLHHPVQMPH